MQTKTQSARPYLRGVHQNVVLGGGGVVVLRALAPVVTRGVRKDGAVVVEGAARDGLAGPRHRLEPLLAVLVPKIVCAIRSGSRERAMHLA